MYLVLIAQDYAGQHNELIGELKKAGIAYMTCKNDEIDISIAAIQNSPDLVIFNSSKLDLGAISKLCEGTKYKVIPQKLVNIYTYEDPQEIKHLTELGICENHQYPYNTEQIVRYIFEAMNTAPADLKDFMAHISGEIDDILHSLGHNARQRGSRYIREAVIYLLFEPHLKVNMHGDVYRRIAEKNDTSAKSVEHSIRISIESYWKNGDPEALAHIMGSVITDNKRPSNSNFIICLANAVRYDNAEYFNAFAREIANSTGSKLHI